MIERTIVLPVRDNEQHSLLRLVGRIKLRVLDIAGGYSEVKQSGAWKGENGRVYYDDSIRLTTTVDAEQDAALLAQLPDWAKLLRQECLYTHSINVDAAFVYPATQQTAVA